MSRFTNNLAAFRAGVDASRKGWAFSMNPHDTSCPGGAKSGGYDPCKPNFCFWVAGYWYGDDHPGCQCHNVGRPPCGWCERRIQPTIKGWHE